MEKVTLFELERSDIYILIEVYFNEKGQLRMEGLDCGETVKAHWGDYDYEYEYTIEPDEVDKLYALLGVDPGDKEGLLAAIKQQFSFNEAYSKFGEFLTMNNIQYSAFSWV